MDLTRLNRGEKVAGAAGALLILIMFIFPWFGTGAFDSLPEGTRNGWHSYGFTKIVLLITGLAAVGLALVKGSNTEINLPVLASAVVAGLGIISVILIVISVISPPDLGVHGFAHTRKIGVWLGLIAASAVTVGGWLAMQEERISFGSQAER
jgi:hypothetical protein